MATRRSATIQRRRLGVELRNIREQAELTIEEVARKLECSDSKVSRIETGQVSATPRDVRDMLDIYKVDREQRDALVQLAREARHRGWWEAYSDTPVVPLVGLETAARQILEYEAMVVPGLLQTWEYARAAIRAAIPDLLPERVDRWAELRMARQSLFTQNDPPEFVAVLDECLLRRPVGGREILRDQLRHLTDAATLPTVTLQVLPLEAGAHAALSGAFTIYRFAEETDPDVVYLELARGEPYYIESAREVRRYVGAFERLRATALSPDESAAFLAELPGKL